MNKQYPAGLALLLALGCSSDDQRNLPNESSYRDAQTLDDTKPRLPVKPSYSHVHALDDTKPMYRWDELLRRTGENEFLGVTHYGCMDTEGNDLYFRNAGTSILKNAQVRLNDDSYLEWSVPTLHTRYPESIQAVFEDLLAIEKTDPIAILSNAGTTFDELPRDMQVFFVGFGGSDGSIGSK